MDEYENLPRINAKQFFEEYFARGKVTTICRTFNNIDDDNEFLITTVNGSKFVVNASSARRVYNFENLRFFKIFCFKSMFKINKIKKIHEKCP